MVSRPRSLEKGVTHRVIEFLQRIIDKGKRLSGVPPAAFIADLRSAGQPTPPSLDKIPPRNNIKIEAVSDQPLGQPTDRRAQSAAFKDSIISVAVDVSTSTTGLILSQEALAISQICHRLSEEAREKGKVLPWSGVALPVCQLTDSAYLRPSYGTDPSVLCSDATHTTALKECDLWFLMTDGHVDEKDIQNFAYGIARNGLHGTTCVIVLFGYLPNLPSELNTSVGISVFAVAPNCLFLFHDVESGTIYVLQHKGCFTTVFKDVWSNNPVLDHTTSWENLAKTTYEQLATLRIPKAIKLGQDDVALAGGKIINIQELYRGQLDPQTVSQIFNNDDNMKTVLLTAATRGKSVEVEAWLQQQRTTALEYFTAPRPDIHQEAHFYSKKLIRMMKTKHSQIDKTLLQSRLRDAHAINWKNLQASVEHRLVETETLNNIVEDSLNRVRETTTSRSSVPASLGPVSAGGRKSPNRYQRERQPPQSPSGYPSLREAAGHSASAPPYLYTPNYRRRTDYDPELDLRGYCCLCGALTSPVALLLKKPDPSLQTEGLPPPGSQARLAFPLAMGNFPETDIISTFVCCDPCSYFVTQIGEAPPNEKIVGVLILTNFSENYHLWQSALDAVLRQRFAVTDLRLLTLAILYTTLQDIGSESEQPNPTIHQALLWAIDKLQQTAMVPISLSQSLAAPGEEVEYLQFFTVLEKSFLEIYVSQPPILRYPVEGFAILVHAVQTMRNLEQRDIDDVVFQKFLFHLTEQFIVLRIAGGHTGLALPNKLSGSKANADFLPINAKTRVRNGPEDQQITATSVTVSSLCGGPLLSEEALAIFRTMTPSFPKLEETGADSIGKFVQEMVQLPEGIDDPATSFDLIRKRLNLQ